MKNKVAVLSLLSLGIVSCVCTWSSCASAPTPTNVNTPCVAGNCTESNNNTSSVTGTPEPSNTGSEAVCKEGGTLACVDPAVEELKTQTVKGDTWEITFPDSMKKKVALNQDIVLSVFSEKDKVLLVLLKEKFEGSFDQYLLTALRGIKETGATVESTRTLDLNGNKFSLLETVKNDIKIWTLVSAKGGFGYGLSCGGPAPHDNVLAFCTPITDSFKLN